MATAELYHNEVGFDKENGKCTCIGQVHLYCGELCGSVKCEAVEFGVLAVLAHDEAEIYRVLSGHGAHQVGSFRKLFLPGRQRKSVKYTFAFSISIPS